MIKFSLLIVKFVLEMDKNMHISYTVIQVLFILGLVMFVSGYIMNVIGKTDNISDVGADAACALALLVIYGFVIVTVKSGSEFAEAICGGIPFVDQIADFGNIKNAFSKAPVACIISFCDTVVLSALIGLLRKIFGVSRNFWRNISFYYLFTCIAAALIALVIFKTVVKQSSLYASIITTLGVFISGLSTFSTVVTLLNQRTALSFGVLFMTVFSDNPVSKFIRKSLFDAIIYVMLILFIETFFGELNTGISAIVNLIVGFAPTIIMIIGLVILLRSLKIQKH